MQLRHDAKSVKPPQAQDNVCMLESKNCFLCVMKYEIHKIVHVKSEYFLALIAFAYTLFKHFTACLQMHLNRCLHKFLPKLYLCLSFS